MNSLGLKKLILIALNAAMLCVMAPFSLPIGAVPISLSILAVYLIGGILPPFFAASSVFCYILLGGMGLPVFSGFTGGVSVLFGPTGGYIWSYIPCVLIISFLAKKWEKRPLLLAVALILGTLICYLFGTLFFMLQTSFAVFESLLICVLPFLPGDALKIACAAVVAPKLRHSLTHRMS